MAGSSHDYASDVAKYTSNVDQAAVDGIARYCGIALQKRDSSFVAASDPGERKTVRENFLKKKLGLTQDDAALDASIKEVAEKMKGTRDKHRVTVYYLLAEKYGKLGNFHKAEK